MRQAEALAGGKNGRVADMAAPGGSCLLRHEGQARAIRPGSGREPAQQAADGLPPCGN
ncbi:hypothetical protein [Massilia mucilaginosa]|uniref:hypothetical protein n=1 Tax=Massilia mucilaginosa TaxID=2609282 RepID=UPI001CB6E4CD|nr:hypothetical protein [Massilia mucilaginosa]